MPLPKPPTFRDLAYKDFPFFLEHVARVKGAKVGELVAPWPLRYAQEIIFETVDKQMREGRPVRVIIDKSRKMGSSTIIQLLNLWLAQKYAHFETLTMAQSDEDTLALFDISKTCWEAMRPDLRVHLTSGETKTKVPDGNTIDLANGSKLVCRTQGGSVNKGRGATPRFLHLSEVPSWETTRKTTSTDELAAAVLSSVPTEESTFIFVESTPKGASGLFYDMWCNAVGNVRGNLYAPIFLEWFRDKRYVVFESNPLAREKQEALCKRLWTASEQQDNVQVQQLAQDLGWTPLQAKWSYEFKLPPERVNFWQQKLVNDCKGSQDRFNEEYPMSADIGFASSGGKYFSQERIQEDLKKLKLHTPWKRGALEGEYHGDVAKVRVVETEEDLWRFHRGPVPGHVYRIAVDSAGGGKTSNDDFAAINVVDQHTGEQVAMYYAQEYPEHVADQAAWASWLYNGATVAPENNNHGMATVQRLRDAHPSVPLWHAIGSVKTTSYSLSAVIGFATNTGTRPLVWNTLRQWWMSKRLTIYDDRLLRDEMTHVLVVRGRPEHADRKHDDGCMSLGIALLTLEKDQEKDAAPEEQVRRRSAAVFTGLDEELIDGEDMRIEDEEVWL